MNVYIITKIDVERTLKTCDLRLPLPASSRPPPITPPPQPPPALGLRLSQLSTTTGERLTSNENYNISSTFDNRYQSSAVQFFCPNIYHQLVTDSYIASSNGGAITAGKHV